MKVTVRSHWFELLADEDLDDPGAMERIAAALDSSPGVVEGFPPLVSSAA